MVETTVASAHRNDVETGLMKTAQGCVQVVQVTSGDNFTVLSYGCNESREPSRPTTVAARVGIDDDLFRSVDARPSF